MQKVTMKYLYLGFYRMVKLNGIGIRSYIFIVIAMVLITARLWGVSEMEHKDAYLGNSSRGGSSGSSASVELAFEKAMKEAQNRQHETFTIEHVLLALLDESSAREILETVN